MDFKKITESYYSEWLGGADIIPDGTPGVCFIRSPRRNECQPGYPNRYDVWALALSDRLFVSYSDAAASKIPMLREALSTGGSPGTVADKLGEVFSCRAAQSVKFVYRGYAAKAACAQTLGQADFPAYRDFFAAVSPGCADLSWLWDYFEDMIERGLCCGVFDGGLLVSCTDAPDMPYMRDKVQEIGINTRADYRGRGYAADCCALCAETIADSGRCPMWSAAADNAASLRLAEKVGFAEYARVFTVTL